MYMASGLGGRSSNNIIHTKSLMELHAHKKARQGAEIRGKALRKGATRCALQKQARENTGAP